MLGKYWVPSREGLVSDIKYNFLEQAMDSGFDIIIDNMNLNPKEVNFYKTCIEEFNKQNNGQYKLEFKDFFVPVEECIRRDALRPNPIGEKVIRDTWNRYKHFIQTESVKKYLSTRLKQDIENVDAIVLDMDSTLCFNITGRPWYGEGAAEGMLNDRPNMPIINLANIYSGRGYYVFIITGRDTSLIEATEKWLKTYKVNYDKVFYRKTNDFRRSSEVKKEIINSLLKTYNIELIVDDSDSVAEMYRDMGLTVLQPNKLI